MAAVIDGLAFSDEETREMIRRTHQETGYTIDPHGAVGLLAAEVWRFTHPGHPTITLETAHPAKFLEVMEAELGKGVVEIPERLAILADREKVAMSMAADESGFKDWLNEH
jgi:threonine synthase